MADSLKRAWITWETQRRSIELSKALSCDFFLFEYSGMFRYPKCIIKTIAVMRKKHYKIIFVQNPSMLLAVVACLCKIILNKIVIVDRHSTFKLKIDNTFSFKYVIYTILNSISIRLADLTIVTNTFLSDIVTRSGGKAFVLPDKVPDLKTTYDKQLEDTFNLLFICSYHHDEPVVEVLKAVENIKHDNIVLYVTGNCNKLDLTVRKNTPSNVVFTGFLDEFSYVSLLFAVDAVIVLTTADHTMLCGCYEAVAACKPLITSKKDVLINYFKGCVFVENTRDGILGGIQELMNNYHKYSSNAIELKKSLNDKWNANFMALGEYLSEKN